MTDLTSFPPGTRVIEVQLLYDDDGDSPLAAYGSVAYFSSLIEAQEWATHEVDEHEHGGSLVDGGFWYAGLAWGHVADGVGQRLPFDFTFRPDDDAEAIDDIVMATD